MRQAEKVTNGESIEEKADTTELENAVKSAEALVMEEYTQSSWAVLSLRLNDAKELLETAANETVEQQAVDKAVENLNLAVAQLEKYREIARALGVKGVDDMSVEEYRKAAVDAVQKLSVDVGIPTKLEALKEEDLQFLAESAHADACAPGNPKDASVEDLKELFRKLM